MSVALQKTTQLTDQYPSRVASKPSLTPRKDPVVYGHSSDGPLTVEALDFYERNGYLTFDALLSAADLKDCQDELTRLRADDVTKRRPETVLEPGSNDVRSIFAVHEHNKLLNKLCRSPKLVGIARQLLGSDVYLHQSRINYKPGFKGRDFYWHSDFETWHVEDGMPRMRALSCSICLTPNTPNNGPLMVIPGSHRQYLACIGKTPDKHYKQSLKAQKFGVPDDGSLATMVERGGIIAPTGPAGSVTFFECNMMHGSNSNITPWPRSNLFMVFNSVENTLVNPFCGLNWRPQFIANRTDTAPIVAST